MEYPAASVHHISLRRHVPSARPSHWPRCAVTRRPLVSTVLHPPLPAPPGRRPCFREWDYARPTMAAGVFKPRTIMTCVAESMPTRPTRAGTAERRLRPNQEKAWHRPPDEGHASLISANCGFIPADWRAAQGREMPANAKATNNDKAVANTKPSATARGRGKPSDFMAASPQPDAGNC
jgi:hypothetical protein